MITLDELCKELGIVEGSAEEYEELLSTWELWAGRKCEPGSVFLEGLEESVSYAEQARLFDGSAIRVSRVIAPAVARAMWDSKTVLEVGFGTALRLCYYARNFPQTYFTGIDKNLIAVEFARERVRTLSLDNVDIIHQNMLDIDPNKNTYDAVVNVQITGQDTPSEEILRIQSQVRRLVSLKPGSRLVALEPKIEDLTWKRRLIAAVKEDGFSKVRGEEVAFEHYRNEPWECVVRTYTR
ncbi:MAG: class I SAM-dependent methyltransferase [Nanoarchaeota archaeon]